MLSHKSLKFKPPLTGAAKETIAALKAELEMEIQKIKQCSYKPYECTQLTLENYNYCLRHILQDKSAPYKQCAYVYNSNGKRCHLPAPKDKKDSTGFCNEHALKTHLTTSKRGNRCQPPRTSEVLVHSISHYIKKPRSRTVSSSSTQYSDEDRNVPDENEGLVTKSLDPFTDVNASNVLASGSDVLDMCSESESDVDATSYGSVWHDAQADSSDNESVDSEQEDVLKHANIYSAEEVTLITRDKLMRLQSLYNDQFRYLTHMLRERRRQYLCALKREKETYCSIYNQIHDGPKEQRLYKKLKAYNSYHKKHGIEAICQKRLHEQRMKLTEGSSLKPHTFSKCIFTEGGVKCGERALPVTRHCRKHILEDTNQILFRACSKMGGDIECATPVEAIFDNATCRLHMDIPTLRSYAQLRKDSESDYDESLEAHGPSTSTAILGTPVAHLVKFESSENAPYTDFMDISATKIDTIKEEMIENGNQNSLEASEFVDTDVEMTLANSEQSKDTKNNSFDCLPFSDPAMSILKNENIESSAGNTKINTSDMSMGEDPIVNTEISAVENSFTSVSAISASEISAIEDPVVATKISTAKLSPTANIETELCQMESDKCINTETLEGNG